MLRPIEEVTRKASTFATSRMAARSFIKARAQQASTWALAERATP